MTPQEYLDQTIIPAADTLGILTLPHLQIGFGTCAQESNFRNVRQDGGGPAIGLFQMEKATHDSLWANFIIYRPSLKAALKEIIRDEIVSADLMMMDIVYSAAMMLIRYLDSPGEIPDDLAGQAAYWKLHYNTPQGAGTECQYIVNYNRFSAGVVFPGVQS